jgi:hypothetical protein
MLKKICVCVCVCVCVCGEHGEYLENCQKLVEKKSKCTRLENVTV